MAANNKARSACAVLLAMSAAANCRAFETQRAEARYEARQYRVELELLLDARVQDVEAVLRDYERYSSLSGSILEAKVLERPAPDVVMLYTKLRACAGLFCRAVKRVERVQEGPLELRADALPEQSEVEFGRTITELEEVEGRTRVRYFTAVTPKFWVPAFIGRQLMLRTLKDNSLDLFRRVEARAKQ